MWANHDEFTFQIVLFYFALFDMAHEAVLHQDVLWRILLLLLDHVAVFLVHGYCPVLSFDLTLPGCLTLAAPHESILQDNEAIIANNRIFCATHGQELVLLL